MYAHDDEFMCGKCAEGLGIVCPKCFKKKKTDYDCCYDCFNEEKVVKRKASAATGGAMHVDDFTDKMKRAHRKILAITTQERIDEARKNIMASAGYDAEEKQILEMLLASRESGIFWDAYEAAPEEAKPNIEPLTPQEKRLAELREHNRRNAEAVARLNEQFEESETSAENPRPE